MKTIIENLKVNGFHIFKNVVSQEEIKNIKESTFELLEGYSEENVKDRLFYRREQSHNRQGDALMVCDTPTDLPSIDISGNEYIRKYFNLYNSIIESAIGKEMKPKFSRSMMNVQQYYEDSLAVFDHYDGEFIEYHHTSDSQNNEYVLNVDKALLPKYVMVVVLENENNGKGTYIRAHDSNERIDVELFPGDVLIFDNINMRHGVPALEKPRMMIGFRNFDFYPEYFEANPEGGNTWIELPDNKNPGWIMESTPEVSEKIQKDFIKFWKESGYDENVKNSRPAF